MKFIVKTTPEEVIRAKKWWDQLEMQWKMTYNEACYGKGPVLEPPTDDELMFLLIGIDTLRFAGPLSFNPNTSTSLTNLSGIVPLYNLRLLSVTDMQISDISVLQRFTKLEHLFLNGNKIVSLKGIENLTNLQSLYLQENSIADLTPLKKLTNLRTLYVSNNEISSLNGITTAHEENMRELYVLPNKNLRDREIIRVQNEIGIICRKQ